MSVSTEEVVQYPDFMPEPAVDHLILEADADHLDFIPDDPAELRRAVTRMAAHINLADWRFIKLIAAMERTRGWQEGGYCNLGNWLDHRCGLGSCAARERIRIGRALARLPRIDAAFRDGVISYSKVRAITRVATPDTDAMLLAIAEGSSAAQLESLVRTYERVGADDRECASSEQRRGLSWYYEDGMLVITAAVPAERGALVIKALQEVVDARRDEREAHHQSALAATCRRGTAGPAADEDAEDIGRAQVAGQGSDGAPIHAAGNNSAAAESVVAGDDFDAAAATARSPAEGAGAIDGKAVPTRSEWSAVDVSTDVSAETPADRAGSGNGKEVSTRAASTVVTDVDAAGGVSAETDDLPAWLIFELASTEQRFADALVDMAEHCLAGRGKRRRTGQRYQVMLTIDRNELAGRRAGRALLRRARLGHRRGGCPPHRLRRRSHRVYPGCAGQFAQLRAPAADRAGPAIAGIEAARPQPLPLPGLCASAPCRGTSCPALDRRRGDPPREPRAAVQRPSPAAASRCLPDHDRGR